MVGPNATALTIVRISQRKGKTMSDTLAPRIYVACLAAYNNGVLHGEWISADQDADDIYAAIEAMLAKSPIPNAEEFAIHDYDEFGEFPIGEYTSIRYVSVIGQAIAEHGYAMSGWLEGNTRPGNVEEAEEKVAEFEDKSRGVWDSFKAFVEDMFDSDGTYAKLDEFKEQFGDFGSYITLDTDAWIRDWEHAYTVVRLPDYSVAVFEDEG